MTPDLALRARSQTKNSRSSWHATPRPFSVGRPGYAVSPSPNVRCLVLACSCVRALFLGPSLPGSGFLPAPCGLGRSLLRRPPPSLAGLAVPRPEAPPGPASVAPGPLSLGTSQGRSARPPVSRCGSEGRRSVTQGSGNQGCRCIRAVRHPNATKPVLPDPARIGGRSPQTPLPRSGYLRASARAASVPRGARPPCLAVSPVRRARSLSDRRLTFSWRQRPIIAVYP